MKFTLTSILILIVAYMVGARYPFIAKKIGVA